MAQFLLILRKSKQSLVLDVVHESMRHIDLSTDIYRGNLLKQPACHYVQRENPFTPELFYIDKPPNNFVQSMLPFHTD